jgi:hypothetical protein
MHTALTPRCVSFASCVRAVRTCMLCAVVMLRVGILGNPCIHDARAPMGGMRLPLRVKKPLTVLEMWSSMGGVAPKMVSSRTYTSHTYRTRVASGSATNADGAKCALAMDTVTGGLPGDGAETTLLSPSRPHRVGSFQGHSSYGIPHCGGSWWCSMVFGVEVRVKCMNARVCVHACEHYVRARVCA